MTTPGAAEIPGFEGQLIGPGDSSYEEARLVYNAMIDRRPALVARCASADDVVRVVNFTRENDVLLAVRGEGPNGAGLGTCNDGVVADLSGLKGVEVDTGARTARVGAAASGAKWTPPPTSTASRRRAGSSRQPASGD